MLTRKEKMISSSCKRKKKQKLYNCNFFFSLPRETGLLGRDSEIGRARDVGVGCAAGAHSPPPSRLLAKEVEEDVFIVGLGIHKIKLLAADRAADDSCVAS